jgi:hypothetical protein
MSRRYYNIKDVIHQKDIGTVYSIIEHILSEMSLDGKSTNEIFGEIYTRFRTEISIYERHNSLRFLQKGLRSLNGTAAGGQLNKIINDVYKSKVNDITFDNLEYRSAIMQSCILDAKNLCEESVKVKSTLKQIEQNLLQGEGNVKQSK